MKSWQDAYVIVANTALMIMIVQLGAYAAIKSHEALSPHRANYQPAERALSEPLHLTTPAVAASWRQCAVLRFRYGGGAGFVHDAYSSAFVNVDAYGIRSNGGAIRPVTEMDSSTWFFGGSATFGCGVVDGDTIPAQLERLIGEPVFNLGVREYNSAMENRLFNYYLLAGYRPRRVLFLDGIDERCANGLFESQMSAIAVDMQKDYSWGFGAPVLSAVSRVRRRLNRSANQVPRSAAAVISCSDEGRENPLAVIVARRLAERAALCQLYAVECHTFVQPFAGVHGSLADRALVAPPDARRGLDLFEHLKGTWRDADATFITGAFEAQSGMWLDPSHHSAAGAHRIAVAINQRLGPGPRGSTP